MVFRNGWVLAGLIALVPLVWHRYRALSRASMAFAPAQFKTIGGPLAILSKFSVPLEALLLAAVIIALAGPGRVNEIETISENGLDINLVLDISASMQAADFPPNRLEALKEISRQFLERAGGNRISIQAFAKTTFTQSPLTSDHRSLLELNEGLAYESISHSESGGTAIGDALLSATDTLSAARIEGRDQVVILITDGESNLGVDPLLAAKYLRQAGIRLHIIGVGGDEEVAVSVHGKPFINTEDEVLMTSLDDAQLKEIAATAGGDYQRALSRDVLSEIFDDLSRLERTPLKIEKLRIHSSYIPQLALVIMLIFASRIILNHQLRRPLE